MWIRKLCVVFAVLAAALLGGCSATDANPSDVTAIVPEAASAPVEAPAAASEAVSVADEPIDPPEVPPKEPPAAQIESQVAEVNEPPATKVQSEVKATVSPEATPAPTAPAATPAPVEEQDRSTVTFSITADEETGTVLAPETIEIEEGDTVLDVLKRVARERRIPLDTEGVKAFAYVAGIDNLYEFDLGPKSGWLYRVNEDFPSQSAGTYKVNVGDEIEWLYTLDLGKDLRADNE